MITRRFLLMSLLAGVVLSVGESHARKHFRRGPPGRHPFGRPRPPLRPPALRRKPPALRRRANAKSRQQLERRARDLQQSGAIRPLFGLIRDVETKTGGAVLDAFFVERGNNRAYVLDVLFNDGRKRKYVVDATNGQIFTIEEARVHYDVE